MFPPHFGQVSGSTSYIFCISLDLIILDELGFKKIPNYNADDFFEVISKRYEKGSVIVTNNKNFEEWGNIFADNILASAIIDRIVHHSTVLKVNGDSYRLIFIDKSQFFNANQKNLSLY